ncbi:histidine kinase-like ATPase [Piptocephalis cylindrospora]|uniref:Histidine kinase-like ATPase n=1 Tax=Piptocephalis cylindrospora TaxID=1907219 RepID=A0A4P9Y273_9FUNG|nr:histidine kinase-like ATPase [Piptocephalis cylindrospora]|eukprot:RKP11940.1 histidine kinase-like ATPase [Piptocephalis cylindrospora]
MSVLDDLRSQVLATTGTEEKVEVNQRHLIDKILARYSAEFTVFRELLQNANDAGKNGSYINYPSFVEVIFQGIKQGVLFGKDKCQTIIVRNNGRPFRQEDWLRLRKIAEGNPDEQKIGFFGVGFYSLFSMCEEPFVTSGAECMAFYWRGDQLFAKRAPIPKAQQDRDVDEAGRPWTTFLMNLREPMDIPDREEFSKFLASSLVGYYLFLSLCFPRQMTYRSSLSPILPPVYRHLPRNFLECPW